MPHTSIFYEYPSSSGEPYYPIPNERNVGLYNKYQKLSDVEEKRNNVYFVGRLANYKYFNMDQTAGNALKVYERVYPESAPVMPVNEQSLVVVTVLKPGPARYDAAAPNGAGHWRGLCRLAHAVAADDDVLWLVVDQGNERGDDNVKELIKDLALPARSAYFYGNGAEKGADLAFDYIRKNKIAGTVYLAATDNAYHPDLWAGLRRRERGKVAVLSVGVGAWDAQRSGPGSAAGWKKDVAGVAFGAELLHAPPPPAQGIAWVRGLLPGSDARAAAAKGGPLPEKWQCVPDGSCPAAGALLAAIPAGGGIAPAPAAAVEPASCADTPGARALSVVQL